MLLPRWSIVLCLAAFACAPKLNGVCTISADCHTGETCSPDGLCLRDATSNGGGGNPDAGGSGPSGAGDAGVPLTGSAAEIATPASGAFVPRIVTVAANAVSDSGAISDVTFLLNASGTDAGLGQSVVTVAAGQSWSGTISVTDPSFNGAAVLRAVAHRSGAADIDSAPVSLSVDQVSPALTTGWDGGGWHARDAGFAVTAAVADNGSGVASAQLQVQGGNSYSGTIASGTATFQVPATELADAGTVAVRAFSLIATDAVGNATIIPSDAGLSLSVDDLPPAIAPVSDGTWHNRASTVVATITDQGSGVASASLVLPKGLPIAGVRGVGGGWSFSFDVSQVLSGVEGPVSYQIVSNDVAGNSASAGSIINVDTVPPSITTPQIVTTPDYVDGSGGQWFAGPDVAPTAGPIVVSATITDGFLDTSSANQPAVVVAGTRYTGSTSGSNVWKFSLPRSIGQNASGPVTASFDAQDLAGNHPSPLPALTLQFDDVTSSSFTPAVAADTSWYLRSTSASAAVAVTLASAPRSGATVVLQVSGQSDVPCSASSATAFSCALPTTDAPAGSEGPLNFSAMVTSNVRASASATGTRFIDDVPPSVTPATDTAWHTGTYAIPATLIDQGSGVADATLAMTGGPTVPGVKGASNVWTFPVNLAQAFPSQDGAVTYQIVAHDGVTHAGTGNGTLQVDTVPPVISVALVSTPDYVDGGGNPWFQGPTAAPSAGPIVVSATITENHLDTSAANQPVVVVGGTRYTGSASGNVWSFSVPRSVGQNAKAPVTFTFDAQDLAGNHPTTLPTLALQFDDAPATAFAPAVAADTTWYGRSTTVNPVVNATLPVVPRSGIASVTLKVSGQKDVSCSSSGGNAYSCTLPSTYAPAGADTVLGISVVAISNVKITATSSGTRYFDDAPPVFSNTNAIPYPGGSWGHDGSHFTLRDSGTIFTFTVYDCGAGVSALTAFGVTPQLSTRNATLTDSGSRYACANGIKAVVYNVTVTADLSTSTPGSFAGADNTLTVSATVQDGMGHQAGSSVAVGATRRLWQTGGMAATGLAMGPVLVVSTSSNAILGLAPSTAAVVWGPVNNSSRIWTGPAVGGTASSPLVYYGLSSAPSTASAVSLSATTGATIASCNASAAVNAGSCTGATFFRDFQTFSIASDGTAAFLEDDERSGGTTPGGADCGAEGYAGTHVGSSCGSWFGTVVATTGVNIVGNSATGLAIGRGGQTFIGDRGVIKEISINGGSLTAGAAGTCSGEVTVSDNGGSDAPVCGGQRTTFSGGTFGLNWSTTFGAPLQRGGFLIAGTSGGAQPFYLSSGGASGAALGSQTAWAIDASATPVVYLSNGATISTQYLSNGAFAGPAWGLPAVPGTSISDMVMDKTGILYVASNGQVSAIITDSPGLGTASYGWPISGRDACRSYNLEYTCPY